MNLIVVICLMAVATAAPLSHVEYPGGDVSILKYENDLLSAGNYRYAFEQSDGTKAEQVGQINNLRTKEESLSVSGSFAWVGPDDITYTVRYTAGEEGYKPVIEQGRGGAVPRAVLAVFG